MKRLLIEMSLAACAAVLQGCGKGACEATAEEATAESERGVQLWENGPYWAECNVGATKPEEYGYYFWWGDTVGYTRSGGTWTDDYYYSGVTWVSSTGQQMSSSPFTYSSCPTYGKYNSALRSAGWIDSTGNLVAAHDAATAHLGSPWRMPTSDEIQALVDNCTTTWTTRNGVYGRLVTGKGDYAGRSIFLPAAGIGYDSNLYYPGSDGHYWSSTPNSDYSYDAWYLGFNSGNFCRSNGVRYLGQSVRPVRGGHEMKRLLIEMSLAACAAVLQGCGNRQGCGRDGRNQPNLAAVAEALKGGKGYGGAYAPIKKGICGRTFFVPVWNLNRRQDIGELARSGLPHFDTFLEFKLFLDLYFDGLAPYMANPRDLDEDPRFEYFYDHDYYRAEKDASFFLWKPLE